MIREVIADPGSQVGRPEQPFGRQFIRNRGDQRRTVVNFRSAPCGNGFLRHKTADEINVETFVVQYRVGQRQRNSQVVHFLRVAVTESALDLGLRTQVGVYQPRFDTQSRRQVLAHVQSHRNRELVIHVAPAEFRNSPFRIGETAVSVEQRRESRRSRTASGSGRRECRSVRESRSDPSVARTAFLGIRRVEQAAVIGETFRSDRFGRRFVLRRCLPVGHGCFARGFGSGRLPHIGGSRMRIGIRGQYGRRASVGLRGDNLDFGGRLQ